MKEISIPYSIAKSIIQEGDLLFFRGKGWISWLIKQVGGGIHSHVAIVCWHNAELYCIEYREGIGGRIIKLTDYLKQKNIGQVDVMRPLRQYNKVYCAFDDGEFKLKYKRYTYIPELTIDLLKSRLKSHYGWYRILKMSLYKIPFIRFLLAPPTDDYKRNGGSNPVCSTFISQALTDTYVDPVPFKSDAYTDPTDLARSALFNYLFTIEEMN